MKIILIFLVLYSFGALACGLDTQKAAEAVSLEVQKNLQILPEAIESQKLLYLLRFGTQDPEACPESFYFYFGFMVRLENSLCEVSTRYTQDFIKPEEFKILGVVCH